MRYRQRFDAKAYWLLKPVCTICGQHKVKSGAVCYRCKKKDIKQKEEINIIKAHLHTTKNKEPASNSIKTIKETKTINMEESTTKISKIKFDKSFIKKLLEKLKVGNARSIHLNALPGRSAIRLDLFQLKSVDENIHNDFIEMLLSKESFSFPVSYDKIDLGKLDEEEKKKIVLISKRLNNIVIENNDSFLEFGLKNFGFGYPLLIKRDKNDPEKIIKAPLFIWNLDIERSYQNKNSWIIKREEESPIKINELLISHLSKDESVKIDKLSKEVLDDGILDKDELLELSKIILSQINASADNLEIRVEKCPDAKQIDAIANSKPWIQWSGIFAR